MLKNERIKDTSMLEDIIEWDIPNWAEALSFWKEHSKLPIKNCKGLELGSRHGGLTLWLALQGMDVICSDIEPPSEIAREKHERYGVSKQVEYQVINALNIPYENEFDLVIFKSVLGGVGVKGQKHKQGLAIQQMHKALKPGGELWFAENLTASPLHQFLRKKFIPWGNSWGYVTIEEIQQQCSVFQDLRFKTTGFLGVLGRNHRQQTKLGKVDRIARDWFTPAKWRYILIGMAYKQQ
jgi:SAM-dependent methyltransferase